MSDNEETVENVGLNWLTVMGLTMGEEVIVIPVAAQSGQGYRGFLVDAVFSSAGPVMFVIQEEDESPRVSIPWSSISIITLPTDDAPGAEAPTDISVQDLIQLADELKLTVPEEIQKIIDAEAA